MNKLLEKLGFTEHQQKTLKRTLSFSIILCLLVVAGSYVYQKYTIQQMELKNRRASKHISEELTKNEVIPFDIDAHRFMAERLLQLNQPEKAIPHFQRLIAFTRNNRSDRLHLGDAYLEAGDYDEACFTYGQLAGEDVEDSLTPIILARNGIALFYNGELEQASTILKNCIEKYPAIPEAVCFLGQIEASRENTAEEGLKNLGKAIQLDSGYVEGWYQLGRYYMSHNDYVKARMYLMQAIELDPLHIKSHSRLGMVYYYMGEMELAKKCYQTALALNPKDFNTRYNLGELYYSGLNDPKAALEQFKLTLKDNPSHVDANFKAGIICMSNTMFKEAIQYFENALIADPANIRILMQCAVAYERLDNKEQALGLYKKIIALDPLNAPALQKIKLLTHE